MILTISIALLSFAAGYFLRYFFSPDKIIETYITGFYHGYHGDTSLLERMPEQIKQKYGIRIVDGQATDNTTNH